MILNILPLIYYEKNKRCNIMVFDIDKAISEAQKIRFEDNSIIVRAENILFIDFIIKMMSIFVK